MPLTSVQKQLISQLSPTVESKSVTISERGLTYCGNNGKYRDRKGVDHNWQSDALMLHEAPHVIDWCSSILTVR